MTLIEVVVALAITVLTISGIVSGYIYCSKATVKSALYFTANAQANARMEQVRAARWDTSSYPAVDQLVSTNFPDLAVTLDKVTSGPEATSATVKTTILPISTTPPLRRIRVDCIWLFQGTELITNTIETCRSPDQ